jgi:general stress protein 26
MTYEEHLDEVATLLTEEFALGDEAAIQAVMRAQADDFFSGHDDDPSICTLERAHKDASVVFKKYRK